MKCALQRLFYGIVFITILVSCGQNKSGQNFKSGINTKKSNLIFSEKAKWEIGQILTVVFLSGSAESQEEVKEIANEWTQYANIEFRFISQDEFIREKIAADVIVEVRELENNGELRSFSAVGKNARFYVKKNQASMYLNLDKKSYYTRRNHILHEFGHVLGLLHEHSHPYRKFQYNELEVERECEYRKLDKEQCYNYFLKTVSEKDGVSILDYDHTSIMHYSLHSNILKQNITIGEPLSLSLKDKLKIAEIYPGKMNPEDIVASHNERIQQLEMKFSNGLKEIGQCLIIRDVRKEKKLDENGDVVDSTATYIGLKSKVSGAYSVPPIDNKEALWNEGMRGYCSKTNLELENKNKVEENTICNAYSSQFPPRKSKCPANQPWYIGLAGGVPLNGICLKSKETTLMILKDFSECR